MTEAVDNPSPHHSTKSGRASWQLLQFQVVGEVHAFFNQSWNRRNGRSHSVRSNPGPRHWAGRYIRNVSSSFFCQLRFRLRTTRNVLLTSTPSVESLSVCLSVWEQQRGQMKNRSKVLVKNFQGFVLGWCQNAHILFKNMRAPRAFCIMPSWQCRLFCAQSWFCMHDETSDRELSLVVGYWLNRFKNSLNITLCGGYECWEMSLNPISSDIIGLKLRVRGRFCLRLL